MACDRIRVLKTPLFLPSLGSGIESKRCKFQFVSLLNVVCSICRDELESFFDTKPVQPLIRKPQAIKQHAPSGMKSKPAWVSY